MADSRNLNIKLCLALSFLMPPLVFAVIFTVAGVYPFGNTHIIMHDLWAQYIPFLMELGRTVKSGGSLLWTWSDGSDYLPLIAYYLASPLNLILALVPSDFIVSAYCFALLVKIGLAGLFMCLFLLKTNDGYAPFLPIFASLYALCGFGLAYSWHIMWLDAFALLPLVMCGLYAFMQDGKFKLYIISLAVSVFSNFLIGLYVCIFVTLTFLCLCVVLKLNPNQILRKLAGFAGYSAVAAGLAALLLVPVLAAAGNISGAPEGGAAPGFYTYYSYLAVIGNFLPLTPPSITFGPPNVYSGLICVLLTAAFLSSKSVPFREKAVFVVTLCFMVVCLNVSMLDYLWSGFTVTVAFPGRYSFYVSFIIIAAAYKAYINMEASDFLRALFYMGLMGAFIIGAAYLSFSFESIYLIQSGVLIVVYLLFFALLKLKLKLWLKRLISIAFTLVILTETGVTSYNGFKMVLSSNEWIYPEDNEQISNLLGMRESGGANFYRTELTVRYFENNNDMYGYDGISFYKSTANYKYSQFLTKLGLRGWDFGKRATYLETSPLTNLFLNLRYLISRDGYTADSTVYWREVGTDGSSRLLENKYYLPLGFMVDAQTADYTGVAGNPFASQNDLFRKLTGLDGDLFTVIGPSSLEYSNYETEVSADNPNMYTYSKKLTYHVDADGDDGSFLKWYCEMPDDGMLYVYYHGDFFHNLKYYSNGGGDERDIDNGLYPGMFTAGYYKKGDTVYLEPYVSIDYATVLLYACLINHELFEQGYALLSDETLELTHFSDTSVQGDITVLNDGLLYLSIPYNKNWTVRADGEKSEILPIGNGGFAVMLKAGKHTIDIRYVNHSFTAGLVVSFVALAVFVCLVGKHRKKEKPHV